MNFRHNFPLRLGFSLPFLGENLFFFNNFVYVWTPTCSREAGFEVVYKEKHSLSKTQPVFRCDKAPL